MDMVNTTYDSKEEMIEKIKEFKGKTKLKFYKNMSNYYDEKNSRNFKFEEDPFFKIAQSISKLFNEVFLLMKVLQTKPQVKNMKTCFYDLYYTVYKNRGDKASANDQYEDNEKDYNNYEDFITPNLFIGTKNINETLN